MVWTAAPERGSVRTTGTTRLLARERAGTDSVRGAAEGPVIELPQRSVPPAAII